MMTVYIDGQEVEAREGSTVLEAAQAAGIEIPTLCHHPALSNWGACRMCLVEVEPRGQLQPACTFPVSPGLRVHTRSEKVMRARRFVLQLLFSERNHYCMYCEASGECELQKLAYELGLDHWLYPRRNEPMPVDATRPYFVMDHNRCILCRRCVRACSEVSAVHTLGVGSRGAHTVIVADLDVPFGASTCISCGTCLQVCPTGALIDRKSAYLGTDEQLDRTSSTCFGCSIGCGIIVRTRAQGLVRVEGDWDAEVNRGLLCRVGRFEPVWVASPRVHAPLRRVEGRLVPCTWDEALSLAADRMLRARTEQGVVALLSSRATNEELQSAVTAFAPMTGKGSIGLLDGRVPEPAPGEKVSSLREIQEADTVVVLGAELVDEHEVVACFIRRAIDRGARLHVFGGNVGGLRDLAVTVGEIGEAEEFAGGLDDVGQVVVAYGPEVGTSCLSLFGGKQDTRFLAMPSGTNTLGAGRMGIGGTVERASSVAYVYAADDEKAEMPRLDAEFVIAQTCYRNPLSERADLVLPALHWTEKEGHLTNLLGEVRPVKRAAEVPAALRDDREVFSALAEKLGQKVMH